MVIVSPLTGWLFPFQMAFLLLKNGGDPSHLLTGMILQVRAHKFSIHRDASLSSSLSIFHSSVKRRRQDSDRHMEGKIRCEGFL